MTKLHVAKKPGNNTATFLLYSAKTKDGVQEAYEELVHKILQTPSLYIVDTPKDSLALGSNPGNATDSSWCEGTCSVT